MIIVDKDIWLDMGELDYIGITTNSTLNSKGHLIMGAGIAKEAKLRYPDSPAYFGFRIREMGVRSGFYGVLRYYSLFAFQTKLHWRDKSPIDVVSRSVDMLDKIARLHPDKVFGLPFPAINNGGRDIEEILPLLEKLPDNVKVYKLQDIHKVSL